MGATGKIGGPIAKGKGFGHRSQPGAVDGAIARRRLHRRAFDHTKEVMASWCLDHMVRRLALAQPPARLSLRATHSRSRAACCDPPPAYGDLATPADSRQRTLAAEHTSPATRDTDRRMVRLRVEFLDGQGMPCDIAAIRREHCEVSVQNRLDRHTRP